LILSILTTILLPVFVVAAISAVAQRQLRLDVQSFSKAAFYVFSPAMVIDALADSDVSGMEFGQIALGMVVTMLAIWGITELLARLFRLGDATRASFQVTTVLANTGNYGLPVNLFAFGQAGLIRGALVVTVNAIMRSTLGVYLAARGHGRSARETVRQVLSVPMIYAAVIGVIINVTGFTLPEPILKAAKIMGQGMVPSSMVVLGTQMLSTLEAQRRSATTQTGPLIAATLARLVLAPLIAYHVGGFVGLRGLARNVLTLECATPSAVMSLVLATEFDTDVDFAALAILATTLGSLVTVTGWLSWLIR